MSTKKFWCHYLGSDGNTPKRRSIELTDISELFPRISNEHAKTPLWYEREEDCYKQVYYTLYAQLNDNVAVNILKSGMTSNGVERYRRTDEEIVECHNKWLSDLLEEYPGMSEERKEMEKRACQNFIESDRREYARFAKHIEGWQDYDNYLLSGESWIGIAAIRAYEEIQSPILSGLKEIRAMALEQREEEERQERENLQKKREEEERKKAEEEAEEQDRLTQEAVKFKNGGSISGCDVVDLCRRYGISIHLRTIHNLQQVIADINGKEETCQYYRTRGQRRPQLDGCYKTARELYEYLQIH